MNADIFFLIKVVFGIITAIFTLSAAIFTFLDIAQNERTEKTQTWFRVKWQAIGNSRWLTLPESVTKWLLYSRDLLVIFCVRVLAIPWLRYGLFFSIPILFSTACFLNWGSYIALTSLLVSFPLLGMLVKVKYVSGLLHGVLVVPLGASLAVLGLLTVSLWLQIVLNQEPYFAALMMFGLTPFLWIAAFFPLIFFGTLLLSEKKYRSPVVSLSLFNLGVACGFAVTLLAMSIGHLVEPSAYVPQTLQMLISNVMFDGLTMVVTFGILSKALSKEGLFRLPAAVLLDIILAAILATCSLYFGLVFTDKFLSLQEIIHILFARSADNTHFEFSPYFWVMHTTFIPTSLYLLLILFCWTGKSLLIPVRWFFGLGQENKNPLKLTAGLCGIFAAVFGVLFFAMNSAQERVKDIKSHQDPPAVIESNSQ